MIGGVIRKSVSKKTTLLVECSETNALGRPTRDGRKSIDAREKFPRASFQRASSSGRRPHAQCGVKCAWAYQPQKLLAASRRPWASLVEELANGTRSGLTLNRADECHLRAEGAAS